MTDENLFGLKPKAPKKTGTPAQPSDVHRLIGVWVQLFERKFGEKPVVTPADAVAMSRLVREKGAEVVERRLPAYFKVLDGYTEHEGYPIRLLPRAWNRLVAQAASERGSVPDAAATAAYQRRLRG